MSMNSEICMVTQIICYTTNGITHRYRLKCNVSEVYMVLPSNIQDSIQNAGFAKVSVCQPVIRFTLKSPEQISQTNLD